MEIPTVPPSAPPPERHAFEMQVHSFSGGGDVAAKTKMVICDPSCMNPVKMKVIGQVVRYTNILETPITELLNEDGKSIDTGQIISAQKLLVFKNDIDATMVSWRQLVTSVDRYITIVRPQRVTGVRPELIFATKSLSYKLASPTLADLTRAKKVLRCLKETRELNLYLTIPTLKPNDLNKTLKHITGYSDADWAGDPVTRKSTSCTLCYVDQFLLTSECRGQGTVALSSGESEMYAPGALSAGLIFAQATLKEIGLSFLIHARADSSTARASNETSSKSQDETHSHEIPIHSRFGISETFDDVISQDRCESK